MDCPLRRGLLSQKYLPNSPAKKSDLRKGDIIDSINGKRILNPLQISSEIRKKTIQDRITLKINRYGRTLDVEIELLPQPLNGN